MKKLLIVFLLLGLFIPIKIDAANYTVTVINNENGSLRVTVSGQVVGAFDVKVGDVTTNLTIKNLGGSDSTVIKTGVGTHNVIVTATSVSDADYNLIEGEKTTRSIVVTNEKNDSKIPTIKPTVDPAKTLDVPNINHSKVNDLSSLSVSTGTLSPNFSASTTSYKVDLTSDITKFTIKAKAKDAKAKVSGDGEKELKVGENNFMISAVAENGAKKTYTISVYVTEKPNIFIKFSNNEYGVLTDFSKADLPKGYAPTTLKLDGKDVAALKNDITGMILLYLQNSEGKTGFYIYEDEAVIGEFQTIYVNQKTYVILSDEKTIGNMSGFKAGTIKIGHLEVPGWTFEDKKLSNYSLVYLINEENEKGLYSYESTEGTLQKYRDRNQTQSRNTGVWIFATCTSTIGFISSIIYLICFKKKTIGEIKAKYIK